MSTVYGVTPVNCTRAVSNTSRRLYTLQSPNVFVVYFLSKIRLKQLFWRCLLCFESALISEKSNWRQTCRNAKREINFACLGHTSLFIQPLFLKPCGRFCLHTKTNVKRISIDGFPFICKFKQLLMN